MAVVSAPLPPSPAPPRERLLERAACDGLTPCKVVAMRPLATEGSVERFVAIVARGVRTEQGIEPPEER